MRLIKKSLNFTSCYRNFSLSASIGREIEANTLTPPRYNLKHLVNNLQDYVDSAKRRRLIQVAESIPHISELYFQTNQKREQRTVISIERKRLERSLQTTTDAEQRKLFITQLAQFKTTINKINDEISQGELEIALLMDAVPNTLPKDSPQEEQVIKYLNAPYEEAPDKTAHSLLPGYYEQAEPQNDHVLIGAGLGIIDLASGSKVSGNSFYYLLGDAVTLELALIQYALSVARRYGFKQSMPPSVVRREYAQACGFRPRDLTGERQIYNIAVAGDGADAGEQEKLCLTGTAEIPLAAWASDMTFKLDQCPVKLSGVSRSYRAEVGGRGRDSRGLYRVHEFTKVELFAWVPEPTDDADASRIPTSDQLLEQFRQIQEEVIGSLGLHARVLDMPASDLGASAFKKYDIEVWMPGKQSWGEVTSASNCTDYQARRLHTRVKLKNGIVEAHTLNGTAIAVPRVIMAIIENFYDPQRQAVRIPQVLRKYMDDKEWIERDL
ncbi:hypothetical protein V1514DRAFT_332470 [Lipomyces japonicus]|uniref:uncharacterized protein n=1 Tax=Lipomyces japonicus TaxID=56871 RepID=UPI0034CE2042